MAATRAASGWALVCLAGALFATGVLAPSVSHATDATTLKCTFDQGKSGSYDAEAFKAADAEPLSFEVHGIDLEQQTATLFKAGGKEGRPMRVVRAINANHFIEVVNEGFLNLTTIYDRDPKTGAHPAIHSRHFGVLGAPVFSQYTGTCK